MSPAPELARLARRATGDPEQALVQLMLLSCEQLGLQRATLGRVEAGSHRVDLAVVAGAGRTRELEVTRPAAETFCAQVTGAHSLLLPDTGAPGVPGPGSRSAVRCYVGTVVRGADGRELGVLGVTGSAPHTTLNDRDLAALEGLAQVIGELLPAFLHGAGAPPVAPELGAVADALRDATDLEELTRPLLSALHELSGISSTYLTVVDEERGEQQLRYARNASSSFVLPEGVSAPWDESLCKRAMEQGPPATGNVPQTWPGAGHGLGIVTYVSVPVRLHDGRLWGTLCAADDVARDAVDQHLPTLQLFARLIAGEVERGAALQRERDRTALARHEADTDALTGCSSRRPVLPWLGAALATCGSDDVVAVAFVDVDAFKHVNDAHGHATGDRLLVELGERLLHGARPGDLVARLGGDEFVVAAQLPRGAVDSLRSRLERATSFELTTGSGPVAVTCCLGIALSDVEADAASLLAAADAQMYRQKAGRSALQR